MHLDGERAGPPLHDHAADDPPGAVRRRLGEPARAERRHAGHAGDGRGDRPRQGQIAARRRRRAAGAGGGSRCPARRARRHAYCTRGAAGAAGGGVSSGKNRSSTAMLTSRTASPVIPCTRAMTFWRTASATWWMLTP